jgi:hypothetical protein
MSVRRGTAPAPSGTEVTPGMQQEDTAGSRERGLLGRFSSRQRRLGGLVVVGIVVVVILVVVLLSRGGGDVTDADLEQRLESEIVLAVDSAGSGGIDLPRLSDRLDEVRGGWVINLAASEDRRTVGVAARQPDGPNCLFVWSAVGGATSALITDPNLPCVGAIALIAAR